MIYLCHAYDVPLKYTREVLEPIVKVSLSVTDVLRRLGQPIRGSRHVHIKRCILKYGLDTTHFHGSSSHRGPVPGAPEKLTYEQVLVLDRKNGLREKSERLRRALYESGVPDECAICGNAPIWNGNPITFEVDHIDGNPLNNVKNNVRLVCPNCHSQTETYGRRSVVKQAKHRRYRKGFGLQDWENNHKEKTPKGRPAKIQWPAKEQLAALVSTMPVTAVAQQLGVSGVAVRKKCVLFGIPTPPRGFWAKRKAS